MLATWAAKEYASHNEITTVRVTKKGLFRTWYAAFLKGNKWPPYYELFLKQMVKNLKSIES